jgi:hypothetical protein
VSPAVSNVIRPTFGSRPREAETAPAEPVGYLPLHLYGNAADFLVALMADASGPEGEVLKVAVGPIGSIELEAVAVMPATPDGKADADATALAILRTLEILEGRNS